MLKKYDTVIVVDDSGSMAGRLWTEVGLQSHASTSTLTLTAIYTTCVQARDALSVLADAAAEYDQNGIDICFLNNPRRGKGMRVSGSPSGVDQLLILMCTLSMIRMPVL